MGIENSIPTPNQNQPEKKVALPTKPDISESELELLTGIPEDSSTLSVEEAFKHKHVVFEAQECFEKTKINLFDNFASFYTKAYETDLTKLDEVKQKLEDEIYAVRFDPAFFLLKGSLAGYIPEYKTLFFPDMKTYKDPKIYVHEVTHSIGAIDRHADGTRIEDYKFYNEFNEGITEKMATEMTGNKKEAYSPYVKCAQIIDALTDGKVNDAFQKHDINIIKETYDQHVAEGSLQDLIFNMHGVGNTQKAIYRYSSDVIDFEEKNDMSLADFKQEYDAIKKVFSEDENVRLSGDKEKYSLQSEKTDTELAKFENAVVSYVIAKENILKYDNGKNINLICERMANTLNKHLEILVARGNNYEEQMDIMQKFCNIHATFNFSENKIEALENVVKTNTVKLYEKMTNLMPEGDVDIYKKLGIQHNLKWLNNATTV